MTTESPTPENTPRSKRRLMGRILTGLVWLLLIGCGLLAWDAYRFLSTAPSDTPQEITISIAPGATFDRVAWDLKKAGAITDVPRFRLLARFHDALGKIKAGEYMVSTGWTPEQVLLQITEGKAILYRLSVREGLPWWETARAIEEQGFARYEDFKEVIHDPEFLRANNIPFSNAEGFLFPETYLMKKPGPLDKKQAREVAEIMVRQFWKQTEPIWTQLPKKGEGGILERICRIAATNAENAASGNASGGTTAAQGNATANGTAGPPGAAAPAAGEAAPAAGVGKDKEANATAAVNATDANATAPTASPAAVPAASANATASPVAEAAPTGTTASAPDASAPARPDGPRTPADIDPEALRQLIILASLVEKETGLPEERGRVAGVYANRLRRGMLLQCDPTIIYGVGETFNGTIRRSQIDDAKNLYNTYQHAGLPPGPICSPGSEAIQAAFTPEVHDYLFFVATGEDRGHTFSKNLSDHNKAVQLYRSRIRGK